VAKRRTGKWNLKEKKYHASIPCFLISYCAISGFYVYKEGCQCKQDRIQCPGWSKPPGNQLSKNKIKKAELDNSAFKPLINLLN
jgi:hypothetical protein